MNVKLVAVTRADCAITPEAGAMQVGLDGRLLASVVGSKKMRLTFVTAVVLTVYVVVVVGTTKAPEDAEPQAAGEALFAAQFVAVEIVVNAPVFGVVEPIVPGAAHVPPSNCPTFRLGTTVVLATAKGAVPVARRDSIWPLALMRARLRPELTVAPETPGLLVQKLIAPPAVLPVEGPPVISVSVPVRLVPNRGARPIIPPNSRMARVGSAIEFASLRPPIHTSLADIPPPNSPALQTIGTVPLLSCVGPE